MTNIHVQRLRSYGFNSWCDGAGYQAPEVCREGADEIERLAQENERLKRHEHALRQEVERLKYINATSLATLHDNVDLRTKLTESEAENERLEHGRARYIDICKEQHDTLRAEAERLKEQLSRNPVDWDTEIDALRQENERLKRHSNEHHLEAAKMLAERASWEPVLQKNKRLVKKVEDYQREISRLRREVGNSLWEIERLKGAEYDQKKETKDG